MASSYMLHGVNKAVYIVRVSKLGRGHKTVVKREFLDYDQAMAFMDDMEAQYANTHIVEFDTKFG
jgi:hypothetical protein